MKKKNSGSSTKEQNTEKAPIKKKMNPQAKGDKNSLKNLSRYSLDELEDLEEDLDSLFNEDDEDNFISGVDDDDEDEL